MNQLTQTELLVTRDGELDQDYYRNQRIQALGNTLVNGSLSLFQAAGRALGNVVVECATSVQLDAHDAKYGSHLRQDYYDKKRRDAANHLRSQLGF